MNQKLVLSTTNYDMFKHLEGNRAASPRRIEKIKKSVSQVDYITSPIIVNENMEVIDGEGRLGAFKELGIPVEYIIHPGVGVRECIAMNIYGENWKMADYLDSYAKRGFADYIFLKEMFDKYKLPIQPLVALCEDKLGKGCQRSNSVFMDGDFKLKRSRQNIEIICGFIANVKDIMKELKISQNTSCLVSVLTFIFDSPKIDEKVLLDKLKKFPQKLLPFNNITECLKSLEVVYNQQNRYKKRFESEYDEFLAQRPNQFFNHRKNDGRKKEPAKGRPSKKENMNLFK